MNVKTVKAVYENGEIKFLDDKNLPEGKITILITFLEELSEKAENKNAWKRFWDKWEKISVRSNYDKEADVLYLNFKKSARADDSELTDDDIIIRYEKGAPASGQRLPARGCCAGSVTGARPDGCGRSAGTQSML